MGGDMYSPVTAELFRSLAEFGLSGIRFNFRGVGRSTGTHDKGGAEQLDVQAVIDAAAALAPDVPLLLAGWSWGADLSLMADDSRIAGWLLAAAPFMVHEPDTMAARLSMAPKVFAVPENDHISTPARTAEKVASWPNATVVPIANTDHFFGGQLAELSRLLGELVADVTR